MPSETRKPSRAPELFALAVLATDLVLINGSYVATSLVKFGTAYPSDPFLPAYLRFQLFLNLLFPLCLVLAGAYRDLWRSPLGHQAVTTFKACVWAAALAVAGQFLVRDIAFSRAFVSFHLVQVAVLIPFSRILLGRIAEAMRLGGRGSVPVLVVGESAPLRDLDFRLRMSPNIGYRVVAVMPLGFDMPDPNGRGPAIVRSRADLAGLLGAGRVDRIFVCGPDADRRRWKAVLDLALEHGVETRLVPWPIPVPDFRARIHDLLSVPLVPERVVARCRGGRAALKRLFDLAVSVPLAVLLAPLFALFAIAIKVDSRGPVFYRQERLTRGGRRFHIFKFRSMSTVADEERGALEAVNEATGPLFKLRSDPRVTRVGAFLRRFSLDELPQVLNVVMGDLSLVGPRPPLPEEVERYEPWQRHRLEVVQGMTGLWQVSGRSRLTFEEMVLLDLHYIESWSLLLDLEILMETVPTVLHGDGAY